MSLLLLFTSGFTQGVAATGTAGGLGGGTFTRASTATYTADDGTIVYVGNNVLRYQSGALLLEQTATNYIPNPRGEGGTIGTLGSGGVIPTGYNVNSVGGITRQYLGTFDVNGLTCTRWRFSGTTSDGNPLGVNPWRSTAIITGMGKNQALQSSKYVRLVAGSLSGISAFDHWGDIRDSLNAGVGSAPQTALSPALSSTLVRYNSLWSTGSTGTPPYSVIGMGCVIYTTGIGAVIDFTVDFGGWQLELGSTLTSLILPPVGSPAATTRASEGGSPTGLEIITKRPTGASGSGLVGTLLANYSKSVSLVATVSSISRLPPVAGAYLQPMGCNADGTIVVGFYYDISNNKVPCYWQNGVAHSLNLPADGSTEGVALACSDDGSVIVGNCTNGVTWALNGTVTMLDRVGVPTLGELELYLDSHVYSCSANGRIIIGYASNVEIGNIPVSVRWVDGVINELALPDSSYYTIGSVRAYDCSSDGRIIVGWGGNGTDVGLIRWVDGVFNLIPYANIQPFPYSTFLSCITCSSDGNLITFVTTSYFSYVYNVATASATQLAMTDPINDQAIVYDISGTGRAAGSLYISAIPGWVPAVWSANGTLRQLPRFSDSNDAFGISRYGNTVVGYGAESDNLTLQGFVWTVDNVGLLNSRTLSGVSATGTISTARLAAVIPSISGTAGTGQAGTERDQISKTPTAVSATGQAGSAIAWNTTALTAVSSTGQIGSAIAWNTKPVTAVSSTGQAGSVSETFSNTLSGVSATGQVGSAIAWNTKPVTAVSSTGQAGTVGEQISKTPTGVSGTGQVGTASAQTIRTLTAVSGTGQTGTISKQESKVPTGVFGLGLVIGGAATLELEFLSGVLDPRITFTRASNATYFDAAGVMQTAGTDVPRFDYNPLTLIAKGLLIEDARTNVLLNSATLVTQSVTVTATAYMLSFYGTGTVTLSGTFSGSRVGSGAYPTRSTLAFTPTAGSLTLTVTGTVTKAQLEAGTYASSYILTTGATATRQSDEMTMPIGPWFNADTSSLAVEAIPNSGDAFNGFYQFYTDNDNRYQLYFDGNNRISSAARNAGVQTTNAYFATASIGSVIRVGTASDASLNLSVLDGGTVTSVAWQTFPVVNTFRIGWQDSWKLNGWLRNLRYWPRALSSGELILATLDLPLTAMTVKISEPSSGVAGTGQTGTLAAPTIGGELSGIVASGSVAPNSATLNPLDSSPDLAFSNGNLTAINVALTGYQTVRGTVGVSAGQYCFEATADVAISRPNFGFGVANQQLTVDNFIGAGDSIGFYFNGSVWPFHTAPTTNIPVHTTLLFAVDVENQKIWVYDPNTELWNQDILDNQDPQSNVGGYSLSDVLAGGPIFPAWTTSVTGEQATFNFGATPFVNAAQFAGLASFSVWPRAGGFVEIDVSSTSALYDNSLNFNELVTDVLDDVSISASFSSGIGGYLTRLQLRLLTQFGSITPLPFLPEASSTFVAGCSANGAIIVGAYYTGSSHAVYWSYGVMTQLEEISGGSRATNCSDNGSIIVGETGDHAVYWTNGTVTDLGTLDDGTISFASDCSADGSIIVGSSNDGVAFHAVYWTAGDITALPFLPDADNAGAYGCSADAGIIVGYARDSLGTERAVYWSSGTINVLPLPVGVETDNYYAQACSSDGSVIVGYITGTTRPIRWIDGNVSILPTLGGNAYAFDVSGDGTIIAGYAEDTFGTGWPVVWINSVLTLLPRIPGGTDTYAGQAIAVSRDGSTIAGDGDNADSVDVAMRWTTHFVGNRDNRLVNESGSGWVLTEDDDLIILENN